jgi:hypothetical protein
VTASCADARRARRRGLAALPAVALVAVIAGCGSGKSEPSTSQTTKTAPVPLSIDAPQAGTLLQPTRLSPSRVQVTVDLAGHADSATPVQLDAGCAARTCRATFFSDGAGEWTTRMRLRLRSSSRLLVITASAPASGVKPVRLTLRVDRAPKAAAPKRRRSPSSPSRTTTSSPRTTPPATTPSATVAPPASPAPSAPAPTGTQTQPAPSSGASRGTLVLIGDSLAVGVRSLLPGLLPGWKVSVDGRVSRPLAEGMSVLAATPVASDGSTVLAVSLFTNDDPTHTSQLRSAVQRTLSRVGPDGCVVWATIARPPLNGVSYDAANSLLRRMARDESRLKLVPWAERTAAQPSLLGPDGVHPTATGYRLRAELYAQAARSC